MSGIVWNGITTSYLLIATYSLIRSFTLSLKMNLNDFIHANRAAFEQEGPFEALWLRIADQLPDDEAAAAPTNVPTERKKPRNGNPFWAVHRGGAWAAVGQVRWVASVVLLVLAGSFWWLNTRYGLAEQPGLVAASPAYAKEVTHYASLIDDKRAELRQLTEQDPDLYRQFSGDLESLEANYQTLKADLPQTPNQEVLIQAMIQNLQLQIDLLNEQLRVIERMKQQTTHRHEPASKPA
jgi:negative regulator of sigma E activity